MKAHDELPVGWWLILLVLCVLLIAVVVNNADAIDSFGMVRK